MAIAYLCLGSNLGNREELLRFAILEIEMVVGFVIKKSLVYETEPWGLEANENFLNQVLAINTLLTPEALLNKCLEIEKKLGRVRNAVIYESRKIDIDILFYGNEIINSENLIVPHPRIASRRFVLEPLNEIACDFIHPVLKVSISSMLENCSDTMRVIKYN
jgi:2-amino-4-hydroxy-6-hydroxymethyldihydropteridine diphosphokinase